MTALYIIIGIVLAFFLILSIKASVRLEFSDELKLSVKILCFNFQIAPEKEKKPVRIKDYTFKKHQRRLRENYSNYLKKKKKKEERKAKRAAAKAKKAQKKKADKEKNIRPTPERSLLDWINIAGAVIGALFSKFSKRLHVKIARLKVNVATGDAASTAILYGAVIQSVAYVIETLKTVTNVDGLKKADVSVNADYLSEKMSVDICFVFSLRVGHVMEIMFGAIGKAIKAFFETAPQDPREAANYQKRKRKPAPKKRQKQNNI